MTSPSDYKIINITEGTVEIEFYANEPDDRIVLYLEKATIGVVMYQVRVLGGTVNWFYKKLKW